MNKQTRQVSKESVLPVVREVRESCGCGLVSWSACNSIPCTSVIEDDLVKVTMDTEDADPDREEKLKAAKEKVG